MVLLISFKKIPNYIDVPVDCKDLKGFILFKRYVSGLAASYAVVDKRREAKWRGGLRQN